MNIIEKYDQQFIYFGVLIKLALAIQFFLLWFNPGIDDANKIYTITVLIFFEFVMVHSGVFMSVLPKKLSLYVFFPFYGLFAFSFNAMLEANTILYLFVVFNRMRFAFSDVNIAVRAKAISNSVFKAFFYFILMIIVWASANMIPVLGLTNDYFTISGYDNYINKLGDFF